MINIDLIESLPEELKKDRVNKHNELMKNLEEISLLMDADHHEQMLIQACESVNKVNC